MEANPPFHSPDLQRRVSPLQNHLTEWSSSFPPYIRWLRASLPATGGPRWPPIFCLAVGRKMIMMLIVIVT